MGLAVDGAGPTPQKTANTANTANTEGHRKITGLLIAIIAAAVDRKVGDGRFFAA